MDGYVRRKVIKQTVMTTVYGVTRFGARLQIAKQLKGMMNFVYGFSKIHDFPLYAMLNKTNKDKVLTLKPDCNRF